MSANRQWILFLGLSLMAIGLCACRGAESRKESFIKKGEALLADHEYTKARLEFRNALQIDPDDTHAETLAATAAELSGDYRDAVNLYRSALADPSNIKARAGLAKLYMFSGATDEARKVIDQGLTRTPADPTLLAIRGATRMVRADQAGARQDAEAALKIAPGNEDAAALMASLYAQSNQVDQAIELIEGISRANPTSTEIPVILARLYITADRKADAEKQLQRVVDVDPKTLSHRYRLAAFQASNARADAAEATLRKLIAVAPHDVDAKLALASLIASQRSFEAGEKSLQELIRTDAGNLQLQLGLGRFYEAHKRPKEAERIYRAVIAKDGTGERGLAARNHLASMALQGNRASEAGALLQEVLQVSPRDNDALVMRARVALAGGEAPAAVTDLRAALRDQPASQPIMRVLAQAYQANGDNALAEESLRLAIRANPRDIQTRLALAKLLIDAGRPQEAQPVVDQLVTDRPGDLPSLEAAFRVQAARHDLAAARRTAAAIETLRPDEATGYYLTGIVDQSEGNLDAARGALEKAVSLAPESIEPLSALVRVDIAQKNPTRALARIGQAIERLPRSPMIRNLKAQTLVLLKRFDEAVEVSKETTALAPKWWLPYRTRALAELSSAKGDRALQTYREGIEATGGSPALVTDLAALLERQGKPQLAIAEYEAWLHRDPASDVAANNLAMMLITHRSEDSAARNRALQLSQRFQASDNPAFLDTYAWVRYTRGEYSEAVPPLEHAVDLAPNVPALRARLGLAQIKIGQRGAAQKNLELALATDARFVGLDEANAALMELKRGL